MTRFAFVIAVAVGAWGCVNDLGSGGDDGAAGSDAGAVGPDAGAGAADAAPGGPDAGGGTQAFCYTEPLDADADVSDLVAAYGGFNWKQELIDAMARRWPAGAYLLDERRDDMYFDQFSDSSSWTGMVGWLDTLVHEQTHLFNAYHAIDVGESAALYLREDLILYLPAEQGFARSEIYDDLDPAARDGIYADTYLTGTQGDRGFNALLDELSCYANEVPGMAAFGEYYEGGVSLRDGSVAFLYFLQVYLRVARTEYPDFYAAAKATPVYVDAVEMLWLRTHYFLELADEYPNLGVDDATYRALLYQPANLAEIEMFTGTQVGESNCTLE